MVLLTIFISLNSQLLWESIKYLYVYVILIVHISVNLLHVNINQSEMGMCLSRSSGPVKKRQSKRLTNQSAAAVNGGGSNRWSRNRSSKRDDSIIQERALAAAILLQQQMQNGGGGGAAPFDRSASLRYPNSNSKKNQPLPRSSSSRARSLTDPLLQPHQLVNQVSVFFRTSIIYLSILAFS